MSKRLVVVGGGIAGLAAAWEGTSAAATVTVLEADDRLGGKILTTPFGGRPLDAGADAFITRVPWAMGLCAELGLTDRLVSPATGVAYVFIDGRLQAMPANTIMGVPIESPHPPLTGLQPGEDASIGKLVRERFGDEVADRWVGPLIGGICAGDIDRLSVRAMAPQLVEALVSTEMTGQAGVNGPMFASLPEGMGGLVTALETALADAGVDLRTSTSAQSVERRGDGWTITTSTGTTPSGELEADAVVLAVPAFAAASLLADLAPEAASLLAGIEYASVTLVTLAFEPRSIGTLLDASGFLVPRTEPLLMTACSWYSSKWGLPSGPAILRVSTGRHGDERAVDLDDDELVATLVGELATTMDVSGDPSEVRVSRWPRALPQYEVGHLERIAAVEKELASRAPGLSLAGSTLRGVGIPACIREGRAAARASMSVSAKDADTNNR